MTAAAAAAGGSIYNTREPVQALANMESMTVEAVFILKDFHRHMDDPVVIRRLRDVGQKFSANRRTVIITAPEITVPAELAKLVEYFDLPLPDRDRLHEIVHDTFTRLSKTYTLKLQLDAAGVDAMSANLRGLTEEEAERAISQAAGDALRACARRRSPMCSKPRSSCCGIRGCWSLSRLRQYGEHWRAGEPEALAGAAPRSVGGFGTRVWAGATARSDHPRRAGVRQSRLCARAVAGEWKLPLVKFDTSAVYDKYIGETEKRIRKVFQVAEGLAPCVLWIDELEKVFAGSGPDSASADAGVSSRLLASFLSWMQDRKAPVFVAATCNNVTVLPPELIRKGTV